MVYNQRFILINNIKLSVNASESEAFSVARGVIKRLGLTAFAEEYTVFRRSVDARRKPDVYFVYSIAVSGHFPDLDDEFQRKNSISLMSYNSRPEVKIGEKASYAAPVVVGAGPCGLFAALILAENGYKPVVVERGGPIFERVLAVDTFNTKQILDVGTNIQFGAGGAGTFSDGKLVTRINDPLTNYVLERFVDFGAPKDILYLAKPHIGTDILSRVVDRIIERICELGGNVLYHTKFISPITRGGEVTGIHTDKGDIPCNSLIIATGHSARDTYYSLIENNFTIEAKSFSVGMRIEHLTEDIDYAMYGSAASNPALPHAEYNLSYDTKNRGTYTFCMCPGGVVVAAASEDGGVVVNGMSEHSRNGRNSNSAVVASVFREDYGASPMAAIEYQRKIEQAAFVAGGSNYSAPIITVGDFLSGRLSTEPGRIQPTYMSGKHIKLANPSEFLPEYVCKSIKNALLAFDKKIEGFAAPDAILTGAETRTSAPVRILRNQDTRLAIGYSNIFPCGEGAGYAGGITSAAIDGIKSALALMNIYKPSK